MLFFFFFSQNLRKYQRQFYIQCKGECPFIIVQETPAALPVRCQRDCWPKHFYPQRPSTPSTSSRPTGFRQLCLPTRNGRSHYRESSCLIIDLILYSCRMSLFWGGWGVGGLVKQDFIQSIEIYNAMYVGSSTSLKFVKR